jgi:hypothetical protein
VQLEDWTADLIEENVVLQAHRHQMKGEYPDKYLRDTSANLEYVDQLITRCRGPQKQRQDPDAEKRFRGDVFGSYGGLWVDHCWCPINKGWKDCSVSLSVVVTRLVPHIFGADCDYIFGEVETPHGHPMCPSNGLMIDAGFAEGLKDGKMLVVPPSEGDIDPETNEKVDFHKDKEPYKVRVLDQSWLSIPDLMIGSVNVSNLNGRILHFRGEHRPKKR